MLELQSEFPKFFFRILLGLDENDTQLALKQ